MKTQRALSPLVILGLLASAAPAQEGPEQRRGGSATHAHVAGLVHLEVEKARPRGCATLPRSPFLLRDWGWDAAPFRWDEPCPLPSLLAPPETEVEVVHGVGFVARADGVVVTSRDLVAGASRITVTLRDGRRVSGEVAQVHSGSATAALRVDARQLPALEVGDLRELSLGRPLTLPACPRPGCDASSQRPAAGVYLGCAERGERARLLIGVFLGGAPALPGAPLLDARGRVVGLNAALVELPLPLASLALRVALATPASSLPTLVAGVPPRAEPGPGTSPEDWAWPWSWELPFQLPRLQPLHD